MNVKDKKIRYLCLLVITTLLHQNTWPTKLKTKKNISSHMVQESNTLEALFTQAYHWAHQLHEALNSFIATSNIKLDELRVHQETPSMESEQWKLSLTTIKSGIHGFSFLFTIYFKSTQIAQVQIQIQDQLNQIRPFKLLIKTRALHVLSNISTLLPSIIRHMNKKFSYHPSI